MGRLIFSFFLCAAVSGALARPMDSTAAEELPKLEEIIGRVRKGEQLTTAQIDELNGKLRSFEPVLVALSAWTLSHSSANAEETLRHLEEAEPRTYAVGAAFVKLAKALVAEKDPGKLAGRLKELTTDENPYLQVEAAKELIKLDPAAGKTALERVANDATSPACGEAAHVLRTIDPQAKIALWASMHDSYEIVTQILRRPDTLITATLSGHMAQDESRSPFPATVERLRLMWKLIPAATRPDRIEIRWIAADTAGVAPNNYVISSSKSDSGKTAGEFTLSKPTQGFPPGKYRVELGQAGKLIYTQDFIIR